MYLLDRFYEKGNSADFVIKEFHSFDIINFNHYGLHPVMPFCVTPIWLIKYGQQVLQPHFIMFTINRFKLVVQSWILFHLNKPGYTIQTNYGYRAKENVISGEKYRLALNTADYQFKYSDNISCFNNWYHNYISAEKFRERFDSVVVENSNSNAFYYHQPTLIQRISSVQELNVLILGVGVYFQVMTLPSVVDSTFYNRLNWSDLGHYSKEGAMNYSRSLELFIQSSR